MADWTDEPLDTLVEVVAVATLPVAALAAIFLGGDAAGVVAIVGWLLLVPLLSVLSDHVDLSSDAAAESATETAETDAADNALQRLRKRYAAGELDDVEFERKLERLLETEDVEVPDHVRLDESADEASTTAETDQREPEVE